MRFPILFPAKAKIAKEIAAVLAACLFLLPVTSNNASAIRACKTVKASAKHANQRSATGWALQRLGARVGRYLSGGYQTVGRAYHPACILKRDGKYHCSTAQRMCKTR